MSTLFDNHPAAFHREKRKRRSVKKERERTTNRRFGLPIINSRIRWQSQTEGRDQSFVHGDPRTRFDRVNTQCGDRHLSSVLISIDWSNVREWKRKWRTNEQFDLFSFRFVSLRTSRLDRWHPQVISKISSFLDFLTRCDCSSGIIIITTGEWVCNRHC